MIADRLLIVGLVLATSALPALIATRFHPELRAGPAPPLEAHETEVTIAATWVPNVLWVDARSSEQFARAHIPGALPLDSAAWEQLLGKLLERWHPGIKVVVYCDAAGCDLSKQLAARLRDEAGLPDVYYLRGGWEAWQQDSR